MHIFDYSDELIDYGDYLLL